MAACFAYVKVGKVIIYVDGSRQAILASTRLVSLGAMSGYSSKQGNLVDISGKLITKNRGKPPKVFINGRPAGNNDILRHKDSLEIQKGNDFVEALEMIEEELLPHSVITIGKGPFVKMVEGKKGKQTVFRGSISKKMTRSVIAKQPEPEKIQRFAAINNGKVVALTFDDGPSRFTVSLLNVLKSHNVPATFFVVGYAIKRQPSAMRAIINGGYEIGNHSNTHFALSNQSQEVQFADMKECSRLIESSGAKSQWYRPPGGRFSYQTLISAKKLKLTTVLWTVDSEDWQKKGAASITDNVLTRLSPGAVILLHDGGGDRRQTIAALPGIITGIRSRGYKIVPLNELLADKTGR